MMMITIWLFWFSLCPVALLFNKQFVRCLLKFWWFTFLLKLQRHLHISWLTYSNNKLLVLNCKSCCCCWFWCWCCCFVEFWINNQSYAWINRLLFPFYNNYLSFLTKQNQNRNIHSVWPLDFLVQNPPKNQSLSLSTVRYFSSTSERPTWNIANPSAFKHKTQEAGGCLLCLCCRPYKHGHCFGWCSFTSYSLGQQATV